MSSPQKPVADRVLQAFISKSVSEKLGSIGNEVRDLIKSQGFTEEEEKFAKFLFLEMIKTASDDFYIKMKSRIESK